MFASALTRLPSKSIGFGWSDMAYDKQKVIDLAISQVGYHEKASNNSLDSFAANSG